MVVHVVRNTPQQNISDQQIRSQIDVLNEDYNLRNNVSMVAQVHKAVQDNVKIQFYLACTDPNGNPTNGITRTVTNTGVFTSPTKPQIADPNYQLVGICNPDSMQTDLKSTVY